MRNDMLKPVFNRLRLAVQTLAIAYLDPWFANRHPGPLLLFAIRLLGPIIRQLQPNDRWSLPAFVPSWIRLLNVPSPAPAGPPKKIFMFCCYRGQFTLELIAALLLAWRGHQVTLGYFPKLRSPIKPPLGDSPGVAEFLHATLGPVADLTRGRVRCVDISDRIGKSPVRDEAFLEQQVRSDVVMTVRMERLDLDDPDVLSAFEHFRSIGRDAQSAAWSWFKEEGHQFDIVLLGNGASFENAQLLHVAKSCGIPVTTYEKFAFSKARTVTHGAPFFSFDDLDVLLEESSRVRLDQADVRRLVCERAWNLLNQRKTSSGMAWGWQYQKGTLSLRDVELLGRFGLERDGFVLVCPNVPFDAGYGAWLTIFPSMRDWLERSVKYLLANSDLTIVIRAHPAESRPTFDREKVSRILADAGIESPRVVVLPGDSDVNTYDLMPLCSFGLVFASTTGVEIAMHGKPVIAGADVYYARCGVTLQADSEDAYFRQVDLAVSGIKQSDAASELAAIVYALFHHNLQWPYPYDKPSQVVALSPAELPMDPRIADYVRTLDIMTMTTNEFRIALPEVIDLSTSPWK